jgi:hypothetical protein
MPTPVGIGIVQLSQVNIDSDLTIPAAYKLITNIVQPHTGAALYLRGGTASPGLFVSSVGPKVFIEDILHVGTIQERITGSKTLFPTGIKTDSLDDNGAAEISILEDIALSAGKYVKAPSAQIDAITDQAGTGAVDFSQGILTDDISEYTGAHGIDFNSSVSLAALVTALTQLYRTAADSDNVQKTDATEVTIAEPPVGHTFLKGTITIPSLYLGATNEVRLKVTAKKTNAGGVVAIRAYVNGVDQGAWSNITNSYTEYSTNLSGLSAGDVLTIYCYSSVAGGGDVSAKDLKACCDDTIANVLGAYTWP